MSFDWSFQDYFNLSRRIPLHYQKRYLANISNGSFNASVLTGVYKKKIKKLSENNRLLALALQNDRVQKEELLVESKANADLVLFSRLKLTTMYESLKTAVSVLDEALSLLEMHSSKSIFKCTPKNTVVREDFKEQIKDVKMATIPEESESPENDACKNTKGATYRFFSKKNSKQPNLNDIEQTMNENSSQIKIWNEMISTLKEYEFTVNEVTKDNSFLKKKQKTYSRKRTQKSRPKASNRSTEENLNKGNEISETVQFKLNQAKHNAKIDCLDNSAEKNGIAKSDTLSLNSEQNNLCESIPQEQNLNSKDENSCKPSRSNNKRLTELHKAIDNSSNHNVTSGSLKNNGKSTVTENPSNKDLKNPNVRKHALKNISSKINIENSKFDKMKRKSVYSLDSLTPLKETEIKRVKSVCPLDVFTFTTTEDKDILKKRKSTLPISKHIKKCNRKILFKENLSPLPETRKQSIDLVSQSDSSGHDKEETVKNLTKKPSLVSISKIPPAVSEIVPKTSILQQDVNIFKANKSFCKNISSLSFNQANEIKTIAEDSLYTQNENSVYSDSGVGKSVDQDKKENSPKTELNIEPLLLDGVVNIKQTNEDKKTLRRRQSIICYREPPANTKLRR